MSAGYTIAYVGWFCAMVAGLLLFLYGFLVIRKWSSNRTKERIRQWTALMEQPDSPLEQYLRDGTRSRRIVPRRKWQFAALENYLFHQVILSGMQTEIERISRLVAELYSDVYRKSLQERNWTVRMNALALIGLFQLKGIENNVLDLAFNRKTGDTEKWSAIRVLALLRNPDIVDVMVTEDAKHETDYISEHMYRSVLIVMPADLLEELIARSGEVRESLRLNLIDVLRIRNIRSERVLAWFERLLADPSEECRIRAMKALANFGYMTEEAESAFLEASKEWRTYSWPMRLMTARLMAEVRNPDFVPILEQMMGDQAYLVRIEAGRSILKYADGAAKLRQIASFHPDRFAREAAEEMLEQGEGGVADAG
ncbi:HEAT repeat domain-containing protein [Paenibacillus mesophilus]|uniref:HEAT repeat domain-containing protein n=1 Tax=Paenibacillus mesophilus TaxID=2582849 RepID=UPI00110F2235|nr:HEAT repeat domain-containing protein [Paenibacillus mesophilus]TMV49028.1 HEAT repeat domain-containing protein [Paenibacillus mesophilus]